MTTTRPSPPPGPRPGFRRRLPGALRAASAAALCAVLTAEGLDLAGRTAHTDPQGHAAVWIAGLIACCCLLPVGSLTVRAGLAATASWTTTGLLIARGGHLCTQGPAESGALLVLLALVLRRAPLAPAVLLGTALGAGLLSASVRDPGADSAAVAACALVVAGVAALGLCLRCRDSARERAVAAARDAERLEVAGELHDFVSHHVAAMTVMARATGPLAAGERLAAQLRTIEEAGDEAMTTSRRLLRVLGQDRPLREPPADLARACALIEDYRAAEGGPRVTVRADPGLGAGLPAPLAASVHRVLDEALGNVRKHSPSASVVEIALHREGGRLLLSVRNDGADRHRARGRQEGDGLGLVGIAERAQAFGGSLTAGPLPGGGWEVLAVLPCAEGGARAAG